MSNYTNQEKKVNECSLYQNGAWMNHKQFMRILENIKLWVLPLLGFIILFFQLWLDNFENSSPWKKSPKMYVAPKLELIWPFVG
jgi:hypothetical protein